VVISQNPITAADLIRRFPNFFTEIIGDETCTVTGVSAPEAARPGTMVFLGTLKALAQGLKSDASLLVVNKKDREQAETHRGEKTILVCLQVELAMATVINEYFLRTPYTNRALHGVHPTALIGEGVELAPGVRIGPYAVIGAGTRIGKDVFIGANTVIEDDCSIDEGTVIHPLVYIGHSTVIGKRCEIHPHSTIGKEGFGYAHDEKFNHYRIPHQGRVVLEDDVHLGAGVTIDRSTFKETRIRAGAKFDNQIHIAHNCEVGHNTLLTAGFLMAGSSRIGANFVAGGGSVVTGHIEICDNVQISALSAVGKSITKPGQYGGHPLLPLQQHIKMKAAMTHLSEMRKSLSLVLKKLGIGENNQNESE